MQIDGCSAWQKWRNYWRARAQTNIEADKKYLIKYSTKRMTSKTLVMTHIVNEVFIQMNETYQRSTQEGSRALLSISGYKH